MSLTKPHVARSFSVERSDVASICVRFSFSEALSCMILSYATLQGATRMHSS